MQSKNPKNRLFSADSSPPLIGTLLGLGLICLVAVACSTSSGRSPVMASGVSTLLVLPFQEIQLPAQGPRSVRCPLCGMVTMTGDVPPLARDTLSSKLFQLMQEQESYTVIILPEMTDANDSGNLSDAAPGWPTREMLMTLGQQAGVEAVLIGHIYRMRERVGTAYGASRPASVAFDLHLIRVRDGHLIWAGQFDETQRALSEDLLRTDAFLRRGAIWLTAEALARDGLKQIIAKMPKP